MDRTAEDPDAASNGTPSATASDRTPLRYLVPVDGDHPDEMVPLVCDLVADAGADLVVGSPVTVARQTPSDVPELGWEGQRRASAFVETFERECPDVRSVDAVVRVGSDRRHVLSEMIETEAITTLVAEDRPRAGIRSLLGFEGVDEAAWTGCDTVVVANVERLDAVDAILIPVARGPHSGLAIDTGVALARRHDASVELLHVYESGDERGRSRGEAVLAKGVERAGGYDRIEWTLREVDDVSGAIIEDADAADVTVLGAPRDGVLRQYIFGSVPEDVGERADGVVLVAHHGGTADSWIDRWL